MLLVPGIWLKLKSHSFQVFSLRWSGRWSGSVGDHGKIWNFFMARINGIIQRVLEQSGIERWDCSYHRLYYSWAGSQGKIARVHEDRMVLQILRLKNIGWVTQLQARFGCQTHHRKLRVWRWESRLVQNLGLHWIELAKDRASWIARVQNLTFCG